MAEDSGPGSPQPPATRWAPPPPARRGHADEEHPTGVLRAVGADRGAARTSPRWLPEPPVRKRQATGAAAPPGPPRVGAPPPPPAGVPFTPGGPKGHPAGEAEPWDEPPPRKRRTRIVETFQGPRLRSHTGPWRRIRSVAYLIVVTALVALVVAGVLAGIVGAIAFALHHASAGA